MAKFTINLTDYAKRTGAKLDNLVREVLFELDHRIVMRSPVGNSDSWDDDFKTAATALGWTGPGYVGGRFRANNQYGFGAAPEGELFSVGDKSFPSAAETEAKIKAGIMASPVAGVHFFANNLPYALPLENGYSKQAPKGIYGLPVIEIDSILRDEIAKL